jgi:photosystem II stability/assembly factor-like uncharacterized protein
VLSHAAYPRQLPPPEPDPATTAFYTGGRSTLTATFDGGRSWSAEPGFSRQTSGSSDVTFVNREDGWAIDDGFGGQAVLWETVDGGHHWVRAWRAPAPARPA